MKPTDKDALITADILGLFSQKDQTVKLQM